MPEERGDAIVDVKPTLTKLLERSAQTLDRILQDDRVAASDRAAIALRIVALAAGRDLPSDSTQAMNATAIATASETTRSASSAPVQDAQPISQTPPSTPAPTPVKAIPPLDTDPYAVPPPYLSGHHVQLDNFLSPDENKNVLALAIERQAHYVASSTSTQAERYRSSRVLYPSFFNDLYVAFGDRLRAIVPKVTEALNLPPFEIAELEMQLTAHGDGNFYKVHNDSDGEVFKRTLTYVYYFHNDPKPYSGGNLRMYETAYTNGWVAQPQYRDVEPVNNRLVLFDSRCMHEVLPVESSSTAFEDSRFTINGWLRRP